MKLMQRLGAVSAILWCLAGAAYAAPRVAIITPLGGDVWLGETKLTSPKIAEEGQKLLLGDNGQARVQLLGSSKEQVIQGNALVIISKSKLEKEGKPVSRGSMAVSQEIGSIDKSASANCRVGSLDTNYVVGFALSFPPRMVGDEWQFAVTSPSEQFPPEGVVLTFIDVTDGGEGTDIGTIEVSEFQPKIELAKDILLPERRYSLVVQGPNSGYNHQFPMLSEQERADLNETARAMRAEAQETGELSLLLRLASFYSSFDENEKMADVLIEVVNRPDFKDLEQPLKDSVTKSLNLTLRSLDRKNHEAAQVQ